MILVAGPTPAWQQIAVLDRLRVGEVNRAREVHWCASGKVLNVGLALTQLGASVRTLSLVGSGASGEAMKRDMADQRVQVRWVDSIARQRVCTTLLDQATGQTTEIVENSATATDAELAAFELAFAEEAATSIDFVILTGSLPTGTPSDFYATLLNRSRVPAILDVRGAELLAALPHRPLIVKPNREELAHTVGRELLADEDVWQAMSDLNARGAEWVVVTNGSREVFALNNGERHCFKPPTVRVVNPIGCGDCFTAGLAFALQRGSTILDAIRQGITAAAQNAEQLLPARIG
ncbi:MAG: 1-phosphofructokinase family hexose kinase [Planctomycetaceae bacterium]